MELPTKAQVRIVPGGPGAEGLDQSIVATISLVSYGNVDVYTFRLNQRGYLWLKNDWELPSGPLRAHTAEVMCSVVADGLYNWLLFQKGLQEELDLDPGT